jgi:hypothetical protein
MTYKQVLLDHVKADPLLVDYLPRPAVRGAGDTMEKATPQDGLLETGAQERTRTSTSCNTGT